MRSTLKTFCLTNWEPTHAQTDRRLDLLHAPRPKPSDGMEASESHIMSKLSSARSVQPEVTHNTGSHARVTPLGLSQTRGVATQRMRSYRTDPRPEGTAYRLFLLNVFTGPMPRYAPSLGTISKNNLLCTGCITPRHPNQFRYRSNGARQSSLCLQCLSHLIKGEEDGMVNSIPDAAKALVLPKLMQNGISYAIYRQRLWHGWSPEKASEIPPKKAGRPAGRRQTQGMIR